MTKYQPKQTVSKCEAYLRELDCALDKKQRDARFIFSETPRAELMQHAAKIAGIAGKLTGIAAVLFSQSVGAPKERLDDHVRFAADITRTMARLYAEQTMEEDALSMAQDTAGVEASMKAFEKERPAEAAIKIRVEQRQRTWRDDVDAELKARPEDADRIMKDVEKAEDAVRRVHKATAYAHNSDD